MKKIDLSGKKFGKWTVLDRVPNSSWKCRCECGEIRIVTGSNLTTGKSTCCGCNAQEVAKKNFTTHGKSESSLYRTWATIKARCYRPSHIEYSRYGARGVSMFDGWVEDFSAFENYVLSTIGEKPSKKHSIDRIDNSLGYIPGNIKWSTATEQANNRRTNRVISYSGKTQTLQMWANELGIAHSTLRERLEKYPLEIALRKK